MHGPDPAERHPLTGHPRVGFLKPVVNRPNIEIGDYSYYDDPDGPEHFVERCVLHHYAGLGDRLVIGRFCAIAAGTAFIMNGANHAIGGFSTYPFQIFGRGWDAAFDADRYRKELRGDTIVGNDVWLGADCTILPGVKIGSGAIIGAKAVVASPVPDYAVVAGNPARVVRMRFDEDIVAELLRIAWWDWSAEKITRHLPAIMGCDLSALQDAA